jgi:hypothetical protein
MWNRSVCNFEVTTQRKQSPIRRKFAQSGHSAEEINGKVGITTKNT